MQLQRTDNSKSYKGLITATVDTVCIYVRTLCKPTHCVVTMYHVAVYDLTNVGVMLKD